MSDDPWTGILDDGETIVWQGQPSGKVAFQPRRIPTLIFGLFFAGFALFWMIMASQAGGLFWMFGLLHFTVGLSIAFGPTVWPAFTAKRTWYTLTNQRAFIAKKNVFGRKSLASFPITPDTTITQVTHSFDRGSVYFATKQQRTKNGSRTVDIGFDNIEGADRVYRRMRDTQKALT